MFFVIGILVWLMGMAVFTMDGRLQEFIDVPSLGVVLLGMWGLLLIGHGRNPTHHV